MICRAFLQTIFSNILIGIIIPIAFSKALVSLIQGPPFSGKIYWILPSIVFVGAGLYFLVFRCVWGLRCDNEKGILYFRKTFQRVVFRVREIKELTVFKTFRGHDYQFKTATRSVTIEEVDQMSELITYLRKANPQINVNSPEDHTLF